MVGIGIRFAQDVGVHRKKVHDEDWTVEDELRKRAFWYATIHLWIPGLTYITSGCLSVWTDP
jgi:hypothetical protein